MSVRWVVFARWADASLCDLIREDYPFPIRMLVPPTEELAAARLTRLAPGGRWIVTTEAGRVLGGT